MEQIRAKERYQMRQIKQSQCNLDERQSTTSRQMGQNQISSMKEALRSDGDQIADLVKKLNAVKKDLAV